MLTKKLKKIGKECRRADDPVLLTLATYVDHVVNYLDLAEDNDAKVKEYGDALAGLDLSAVVKVHEALAAAEPTTEQVTDEAAEHPAKNRKKKDKKKADEAPVMADPAPARRLTSLWNPFWKAPTGRKRKRRRPKRARRRASWSPTDGDVSYARRR